MKTIAFYLPQFHEIPENNKWWGEGFTEWTNVKKAKPLFEGHYQPRVPLNKNYYNLLDGNKTWKWQIDIAKKYGVYGFCVYHYWFNGKLLLEKPMENWLEDKSLDFPMCICWANESWTNGWVSDDNKVLIENNFKDKEDWVKHFNYLLPFFKDDRYIKVDGKPLFGIYVPDIMGSVVNKFVKCWKKMAVESGLPGLTIFFQSVRTFMNQGSKYDCYDYGIEFQPGFGKIKKQNKIENLKIKYFPHISKILQKRFHIYLHKKKQECTVRNYDELWESIISAEPYNDRMFPGAFVDWDNTARKGNSGDLYFEATPEKFEKYMTTQIKRAREVYKKDYLFLFAWNEWAECGYMEPDEKYRYGYLEALKNALDNNSEFPEWK